MKDYIGLLISKVRALLGPVWEYVPSIADALRRALADGDAATVKAISIELREFAAAQIALADHLDEVLADGSVTITELAGALDHLQTVADEGEDIATGKDEDDLPTG